MGPSASEEGNASRPSWTPLVYDELRQVAAHFFRRQPFDLTLQPTALVNEAYIRLAERPEVECESRAHFFNLAARAMRQILTDHVRRRQTAKRGGGRLRVTLEGVAVLAKAPDVDLTDLLDALDKLSKLNPRHSDVVTLRFFGGLSVDEVSSELEVSKRTVELDWQMARAWLRSELEKRE